MSRRAARAAESSRVLLVGDGIENPANARLLIDAAAMYGAGCRFRDTKGLAQAQTPRESAPDEAPLGESASDEAALGESVPDEAAPGEAAPDAAAPDGAAFSGISGPEVRQLAARVIACDNLPDARDVYGFRAGRDFALLVGNERRGLSREMLALASDRVQVPMPGRRINCLNVAAAAAVALHYLCGPPGGAMAVRRDPRDRRPELLLFQPGDHFEAGSAIRSAAAFGWERALLEDPHGAWFSGDRRVRAEGRAAARRGRNDILLVPCPPRAAHRYARVTVVSCRGAGTPLDRLQLAGGPAHLLVIPDEGMPGAATADWERLGERVEVGHLQVPAASFPYHYRLLASIALAEVSRQVGRRQPPGAPGRRPAPRRPIYDDRVAGLAAAAGEVVRWEELRRY